MSNYRYNVSEVEDSVKDGALGKLNGTPNDSGDLIKNLGQQIGRMSPDEYRAVAEIVLRTEDQKAAFLKTVQDEKDFLAAYPEFRPTKDNWTRMCLYLEGRGVKANSGVATFEDMEAAFRYLKPLGTLELNKASVRQQEARAINERNERREAAAAFNEEEAYQLPWAELEKRARGW